MRVPTKLKSVSYILVTTLLVLLSAIIWLLITTGSANSELSLVDEIQSNFLERTSLRDQYFLYHEDLIRLRWEENKQHSDRLLQQAGLQLRDKETLQIIGELVRNIDDTSDIFHRIVANSNALKSAGGNREVLDELDKRLSSQLLLKATLVRDTIFSMKNSALKNVQRRNRQLTVTVILMAGSFSLCIIFWNILLKQQVKNKTIHLENEMAERKLVNEEIKKVKNILSAGERIAQMGTFEYIADTNATFWSEGEYRIYGLDSEGPSPAYDVMLANSIHPDDAALLHQTFTAAVQSGSLYELEHRIVRPDGSVRWVHDRANPYFDQNGRLVRYVGSTLDITERKQVEEQIKTSLREKEILLKEIHHRVKNNLQIISSLLKLQSRFNPDERLNAVFQECQDRIRAMAGVHALLYRSKDFTRIDFGDCIRETTAELLRAYQKSPANILPDIHAEEVMLSIDEAIPCSLIINELVTNAVKYAFTETAHGEIRIELTKTEQGIRMLVKDNGVGFPPEMNFRETETLGLQLVNMLVKQLDGTIEQSVDGGTAYAIIFAQKHISAEVSYEGQ